MKLVIWEAFETDIDHDSDIFTDFYQWLRTSEEGQWVSRHFGLHNLNTVTYTDQRTYQKHVRVYVTIEQSPIVTEYLLRFNKHVN